MNMKTWRRAWIALAILLSNLMCATVAYRYCDMRWGIQYAGYSAPAHTAFFWILPYGVAIAMCIVLARRFGKSAQR